MNEDRQHENDHNDAASAGSESPEEGQAAMADAEDAVAGDDANGDSR